MTGGPWLLGMNDLGLLEGGVAHPYDTGHAMVVLMMSALEGFHCRQGNYLQNSLCAGLQQFTKGSHFLLGQVI